MYLRVEHREENEHRHKLAALAAGPYPTVEIIGKAVVIVREDETV